MTALEIVLRLSIARAELERVAYHAPPRLARIIRHAVRVLGLARHATEGVDQASGNSGSTLWLGHEIAPLSSSASATSAE